tara:strand:- start:22 stop:636 length:615 start_codon:yes stop_codon:yes gene_type:complete
MKPNYYAIISAEVRYSDITPNAKLLYAEITAFCNMNGECFASNRYFAELYGKSKVTISKWIKELVDNGFIETSYTYKKGTKEIDKRYITILKGGVKENLTTPIKKSLKNNNTSNNITSINNIPIWEQFVIEVDSLEYTKEIKEDFKEYWLEQSKSGKYRFQLQKTFDVSLRLKRWEKNSKKFNKGHSKIDSQINEYLKGKELLK